MENLTEYRRLRENLSRLKLTKIDEYLPGYIDGGSGDGKPLVQCLRELTDEEIRFRDERAADMNFKLSNFPARKTFDGFDFAFQPGLDRERVLDLKSLRFLDNGENVVFIGSPGVGKTHLAVALGIEATNSHVATYFVHFRDLVARMRKAVAESRETQMVKNICKYKLLIVDEIGYFPVEPAVANVFFQIVAARYEKRSMIVTSNRPLSKWDEVFQDPVICNAIIDRLVHHATIVKINGRSYRLKGKIDERAEPAAEPLGVSEEKKEK